MSPRLREEIKHGTHAGYSAHLRRGEKACDACNTARNAHSKIYTRVRNKTLRKLKAMYPDDYKRLYLETYYEEIR